MVVVCGAAGCGPGGDGSNDAGDLLDAFADADTDGDGISDATEGRDAPGGATDTDDDGIPDYMDEDSDGDGIPDADEGAADQDNDGTPNFQDTDADGDGIPDSVEGEPDLPDTDNDGTPDYLDFDSDGDGINDSLDGGGVVPADTDADGTPDFRDTDSDDDGLLDIDEGTEDYDLDGTPNFQDPFNDGLPTPITLTQISTTFNQPIGIDYHEPTDSVVMSVNYPTGDPWTFERIEFDGTHQQFSDLASLTNEVKIATARADNPGGFPSGDLFVGNGIDGQIVRITDGGATILNPWVDLPGDNNGLMRGSLYVDRTGLFGGDLIVVTTLGQVWRVDLAGTPTMIANVGVHLEGLIVVPDFPVRYGPLAGTIIAGAEGQNLLYAVSGDSTFVSYDVGVAIEDIDLIVPNENFFGVNFGTSVLLGAGAEEFHPLLGDILLAQESVGATTGLFRLKWDGVNLTAEQVPIAVGSAVPGQWEHVTFAPAGIVEVPPIP